VATEVRFLAETLQTTDETEKLTSGTVLEHVVEFALPLEGGMQLNDEGVGALGLIITVLPVSPSRCRRDSS
jgi:hypothetical protein